MSKTFEELLAVGVPSNGVTIEASNATGNFMIGVPDGRGSVNWAAVTRDEAKEIMDVLRKELRDNPNRGRLL